MKKNSNYNYAMDAMKLLFMLVIVIHHAGYLREYLFHGYMAVDFFFMTSGYMLWRTLSLKPELTMAGYVIGRLRKLYPHYVFSFGVMLLSTSIYRKGGLSFQILLHSLPELLLVQNLGIFNGGVNYPCWYLSVLMFAGALVFWLGRSLGARRFNYLAAGCALVSYFGILYASNGSMENFATIGICYLPFWRGVAGLCVGAVIFQVHEHWEEFLQKYSALCNILEGLLLVLVIALMIHPGPVDALILLCISALLIIAGRNSSAMNTVANNPIVNVCIRYEYPVFLNHAFITGLFRKTLAAWGVDLHWVSGLAILLVILAGYSVMTEKFVASIRKLCEKSR